MESKKFILDAHLGKLTRYLRMLGFDAAFDLTLDDEQIIYKAIQDDRYILSKDKALLLDKRVAHGYFIVATNLRAQLIEVIKHFALIENIKPFIRCLDCNGELTTVEKKEIAKEIPISIVNHCHSFTRCTRCQKIFWEGSHKQKMANFITELLTDLK